MKFTRVQLFLWGSVATMATCLTACSGSEPNSSNSAPNLEESASPNLQTSSSEDASPNSQASSSENTSSNTARADSPQSDQVSTAQLETSKPYINQLLPQAARIQQEYGIPVDMTIAIAILETGWGKHVIGQSNHFGLRCISESCVARVKRGRTIQYESCSDPSQCFDTFAQTVKKLTGGDVANVDKLAQEYASGANWARKVKTIQKRVKKILDRARQEANSA